MELSFILIIIALIIFIIALPFIAGLFIRKDYYIHREVVINRPRQQVFEYIKLLKNQENYNKWMMMDPNVKKDYIGNDGKVGATVFWDSENKKVGQGEQEIKSIIEGERIDYEVRFIRPFRSKSETFMIVETIANDDTWVKWGFTGKYAYPFNVIMVLMNMDKLLGSDIHDSLHRLKNAVETKYPKLK